MKSIWPFLKKNLKETVLAPAFKLLEASFELCVPLVVARIVDLGIGGGARAVVWQMGGLLLILAVVGLVSSITAQYYAARAATGCAARVRTAAFAHIMALSLGTVDELGTSTLLTRMTSDIAQVQTGVNLVLRLLLRSPFIVFGAMVMAFTVDMRSALVFAVAIPLLALVVFGVMARSMPIYKAAQAKLDRVLRLTREGLTGARVIRAFGREAAEISAFRAAHDSLTHTQIRAGRVSGLTNPATYALVNAATIALLWIGALRVADGALSRGAVVALCGYMAQILTELVKMANLIVTVTRSAASWARVDALLKTPIGMDAPEKTLKKPDENAPAVEFENVSVTYPGAGGPSLERVNLRVARGASLGVIGGTGAGKSTLVRLIPRFYDAAEGLVKVNGVPVSDYALDDLRARVGVVMQKARLFKGTIAENLRFGDERATDDQLLAAVAAAQAEDILREKGGLEAALLQNGENLSGGQRQRLTIARALVKKPEILILDDCASALDFATELRLRRALLELPDRPALFVVSQRAASVMRLDQIVVLNEGKVAGIGTHETLLRDCPVYQEIYYSQYPKEAI